MRSKAASAGRRTRSVSRRSLSTPRPASMFGRNTTIRRETTRRRCRTSRPKRSSARLRATWELSRRPSITTPAKETANLSEYDYYLRTHDLINTAASKEATDRAARVAEEGLGKYPHSNLVKIQLAWAHFSAVWNN